MMSLIFFLILITVVLVLISYLCFRIVFYVPPRTNHNSDDIPLPEGEIYEVFWDEMRKWAMEARSTPFEEVSIVSFDGLKLYGKYYEYAPGAPIELMFHGYRGNSERDLSGGMQRCFQLGRSALIVDQRCAGKSEGAAITFGVCEYRDCLSWVDFMVHHFGQNVKIILTGISMGASTVLIAAGRELPGNVIGVLADCGFTSAKDIIISVAGHMKLPGKVLYPFIQLGAKLFGGFDLDEVSAESALANCRIPVIFFHGEADDYVPCEMSRRNFIACNSPKKLITISGAGHGLSYPVARERYLAEVKDFFQDYL